MVRLSSLVTKPKNGWKYNIKAGLKYIRCDAVDFIEPECVSIAGFCVEGDESRDVHYRRTLSVFAIWYSCFPSIPRHSLDILDLI
jgi:hypothetical protein